jgi:hypothetical protein
MRFSLLLLVSGLCGGFAVAEQTRAVFGTHEYVEYLPGSLPIVIGAPHGGSLKPQEIPDRKNGKVVQDAFTQELARLIRDDMTKRFGASPHLIICRLHRSKVDCNREISEAAQGNAVAAQAYQEFHRFIKQAREAVEKVSGAGLYIDLHGHRHEQGLVEIGGLVAGTKLALSDAQLDAGDFIARQSSLRELDKRSPQSFSALLRGPQSLGGLLEARGFSSIPSPAHPSPGTNDYYSGAYNVDTHGSREQGTVSAVQIECPYAAVRQKPETRIKFSAALCDALEEYFRVHFAKELKSNAAPAH